MTATWGSRAVLLGIGVWGSAEVGQSPGVGGENRRAIKSGALGLNPRMPNPIIIIFLLRVKAEEKFENKFQF